MPPRPWCVRSRRATQKEIAARLADRFSGPPAAIEREVAGLIGDLQQKGLVEDAARG